MPQLAFRTTLDSASATDTYGHLFVARILPRLAPGHIPAVRRVCDGNYRKVENPAVSSRDRQSSRIGYGRDTLAELFDQSLYERMRQRHVRNSLDFCYLEYAK